MNNKKKLIIVTLLLIFASGNFARQLSNDNIRPIQYISLLAIGGLLVLLIQTISSIIKSRNQ